VGLKKIPNKDNELGTVLFGSTNAKTTLFVVRYITKFYANSKILILNCYERNEMNMHSAYFGSVVLM
jgi:hypothetical protein